jgi:hypothetical protein
MNFDRALTEALTSQFLAINTVDGMTAANLIRDTLMKDYSIKWDEKMYRYGPPGRYYAATLALAKNYENYGPLQIIDFPTFKKVLIIDISKNGTELVAHLVGISPHELIERGTLFQEIENMTTLLKTEGYDGIIIFSESGHHQSGPPIEIVIL